MAHPNSPLAALHAELAAADSRLVGNDDLLRGVLSGCGDCIKVLDLGGRLQFMSEGGKRVMEVDDFSPLKGCEWPSFWEGEGNAQAAAAVADAIAGQTARFRGPANTAKGTARYWDVQVSPIFDPAGKVAHLLSISKDITEEWKALERQKFLTDELQHRVKNMLQTVVAIAQQTFKGGAHAGPRETFIERLTTLDRAHSLLSNPTFRRADVRTVVEGALKPHATDAAAIQLAGPQIMLGPKQALAFALATNELATNAVKYGALQQPGGRVDVRWDKRPASGEDVFEWTWRESGGPAVTEPSHTGFGSRVIRNLLADELGGTSDLSFQAGGIVCRVTAPAAKLEAV